MSREDRLVDEARSAVAGVAASLERTNTLFSDAGFQQLKNIIGVFIEELVWEAARVAKWSRADTISAAHVDEAAERLVNSVSRRLYRHLGTVGGLILGTALSQTVTMLADQRFTTPGVIISASFGIIGAFLVALHIARD